jgi:hypothetical protein
MDILVRGAKIVTPVSSETHHKINFHPKENNKAFNYLPGDLNYLTVGDDNIQQAYSLLIENGFYAHAFILRLF